MKNTLTVYILSDSIGETGELLAKAALSQFNSGKYHIKRFPFVNDKEQILEVFSEARKEPSIIIFTIVIEELKKFIEELGKEYNIPTVDLMTPALDAMSSVLQFQPKENLD